MHELRQLPRLETPAEKRAALVIAARRAGSRTIQVRGVDLLDALGVADELEETLEGSTEPLETSPGPDTPPTSAEGPHEPQDGPHGSPAAQPGSDTPPTPSEGSHEPQGGPHGDSAGSAAPTPAEGPQEGQGTPLASIPGFPAVELLAAGGITTLEGLAGHDARSLRELDGIGKRTAERIVEAAAAAAE